MVPHLRDLQGGLVRQQQLDLDPQSPALEAKVKINDFFIES